MRFSHALSRQGITRTAVTLGSVLCAVSVNAGTVLKDIGYVGEVLDNNALKAGGDYALSHAVSAFDLDAA
jgi:hypothetical protein